MAERIKGLTLDGLEVERYLSGYGHGSTAFSAAQILHFANAFVGSRRVDGVAVVDAKEDVLYRIMSAIAPCSVREWYQTAVPQPILANLEHVCRKTRCQPLLQRGLVSFEMVLALLVSGYCLSDGPELRHLTAEELAAARRNGDALYLQAVAGHDFDATDPDDEG
eukprot:gnl/Hemi2/861_TR310_c0_g1_i1.p1 gnl/Hemi2/861_TR310_c0_g1~~gnl/Hemi2/861_TR310_c0_g1_i1.p1  ORF type:complete len:165 (-),score=38.45 gnl/Hemi2/861_TR310_c0_g1_i1:157-651(-)